MTDEERRAMAARHAELVKQLLDDLTVVITNGGLVLEAVDGPARSRLERAAAAVCRATAPIHERAAADGHADTSARPRNGRSRAAL
ncbi:MAG TPA: hypothetical protein VFC93_05265 [Chloroflexota bacterium]|nr:hypothetical protein [Chloroflexota bacterium]